MVKKSIRIPDKLDAGLETEAKNLGLPSLNEAYVEAVRHFLTCKKIETTPALKHIPLKYPGTCKCGKKLEAGEWAFWGKDATGSIIICNECEIEKFGDKATIGKLLKVKELEYARRVLNKEVDTMLEKYREFNFYEIIQELHDQNTATRTLLDKYFQQLGNPDEQKQWEAFLKAVAELWKIIEEARNFMKKPWKKKKVRSQMVA